MYFSRQADLTLTHFRGDGAFSARWLFLSDSPLISRIHKNAKASLAQCVEKEREREKFRKKKKKEKNGSIRQNIKHFYTLRNVFSFWHSFCAVETEKLNNIYFYEKLIFYYFYFCDFKTPFLISKRLNFNEQPTQKYLRKAIDLKIDRIPSWTFFGNWNSNPLIFEKCSKLNWKKVFRPGKLGTNRL